MTARRLNSGFPGERRQEACDRPCRGEKIALFLTHKILKYVKMFNLIMKISQRSEQINCALLVHKNLIAGNKMMKIHSSQ